jgi:hypothetical protein
VFRLTCCSGWWLWKAPASADCASGAIETLCNIHCHKKIGCQGEGEHRHRSSPRYYTVPKLRENMITWDVTALKHIETARLPGEIGNTRIAWEVPGC